MAKKKFENMNTAPVYEVIAETTAEAPAQEKTKTRKPRKTYSETEVHNFMEEGATSGRKGMHQPRINLAFKPGLYEFVRTMSRRGGITMTDFVNKCIENEMNGRYKEMYQDALKFRDEL